LDEFASLSAALASRELWQIIALSLGVSLSATTAAAMLGLPLGVALAIWKFPGRRLLILAANALLGLPPAVVGLALYLLLSGSGPFGFLGLLFTPGAMVIAQAVLALPIVTALAHRAAEDLWAGYGDALRNTRVRGSQRRTGLPNGSCHPKARRRSAITAGRASSFSIPRRHRRAERLPKTMTPPARADGAIANGLARLSTSPRDANDDDGATTRARSDECRPRQSRSRSSGLQPVERLRHQQTG
jgi:hypothetical protein